MAEAMSDDNDNDKDMAGIRRPRMRMQSTRSASSLSTIKTMQLERQEAESSYASVVMKKILLLPPLLLVLYLLEDHVQQHQQHNNDVMNHGVKLEGAHAMIAKNMPAFITSLRSHPPSLRVFRALSELCLVLFCAAFCLRVWETTTVKKRRVFVSNEEEGGQQHAQQVEEEEEVGINDVIGQLLFQPYDDKAANATTTTTVHEGAMEEEDEHGVEEPLLLLPTTADDTTDVQASITSTTTNVSEASDTSSSSTHHVYFPPPAAAVASSAMDVLLLMLLFLIFFTVSSRDVVALAVASAQSSSQLTDNNDTDGVEGTHLNGAAMFLHNISVTLSAVAAPFFPLVLSFWIVVWCVVPWRKRRGFWLTVMRTVETPYHDVTFRDGLIGDVLTSTVRPLQDIAYTLFYVTAGLQGWWSSLYSLDDADRPLEQNWLLHVVVLPACMISPLWWRFVQNLRQSYDSKKRWPYLGNALKYLLAAEVALFGVFDPSNKQRILWIACFFFATLYQVFWDVFMDWELFVLQTSSTSSRSGRRWRFTMRERRLYRHTSMYWAIFVINVLLRFCWTLSFIPAKYLTRSGRVVEAFSAGLQSFVVPAVACAEIVRRTLWALLRVELEAIKELQRREQEETDKMDADLLLLHQKKKKQGGGGVAGGGAAEAEVSKGGDEKKTMMSMDMDMDDLKPMTVGTSGGFGFGFVDGTAYTLQRQQPWGTALFCSDMSTMTDNQILAELSLWATVFTSLGIFAAAQRQG